MCRRLPSSKATSCLRCWCRALLVGWARGAGRTLTAPDYAGGAEGWGLLLGRAAAEGWRAPRGCGGMAPEP